MDTGWFPAVGVVMNDAMNIDLSESIKSLLSILLGMHLEGERLGIWHVYVRFFEKRLGGTIYLSDITSNSAQGFALSAS